MVISNEVSYENYLSTRRQVGDREVSDFSRDKWNRLWPMSQKNIINELVHRCHNLAKDRDLSWANYSRLYPTTGVYRTSEEWERVPLFVKAAIIRPNASNNSGKSQFTSHDVPQSEVTPW